MIDVEPLIAAELDSLVPVPGRDRADWRDIELRAGVRRARRRRLATVAAVATVLVLILVAVALAGPFGNFSTWLTGAPGTPASPAEQQAFERATRTWAGFPRGTELRRLLETRAGGTTFTLDGFRAAGSLCLRLRMRGAINGTHLSCAPLSDLRARPQPALAISVDLGFGTGSPPVRVGKLSISPPRDTVTMGIVADGVRAVEISSGRKSSSAHIGANAFLYVTDRPHAARVSRIWAVPQSGPRVSVPFVGELLPGASIQPPPFRTARGPATVSRVVHGGAIRWLARREARGEQVPATVHHIVAASPAVIFRRMVAPNPAAPERMVVSVLPAGKRYFGGHLRDNREVCAELIGGRYQGGGCWPAGRLFTTAPFTWDVTMFPGDQYVTVSGLASDDVARMQLFLGTGEHTRVPLHDNAYAIQAALAKYPLRLVAYDAQRDVIGVITLKGDWQNRIR